MRRPIALGLFLLLPAALAAQQRRGASADPVAAGAATITADDVKQRVGIIADDSMMGRDTPSRGLELTAAYIADQFKRFGLKPAGDSGTYFQRYAIVRRKLDPAGSAVIFAAGGVLTRVDLTRDARLITGTAPQGGEVSGGVFLVAGPFNPDTMSAADLKGRIVVIVVDSSALNSATLNGMYGLVATSGAKGAVLVSNRDSTQFAQRVARQGSNGQARPEGIGGAEPLFLEVHERAVGAAFARAGLDLRALHQSAAVVTRAIPTLTLTLSIKDQILSKVMAPNTVGILEGTDPKLKNEYLVYSAHMDHVGITPGQADSINNGADDDGSGTVGVVELAEAFSRPGARPKRSIVFLTVSGEEKGLWGSSYFVEHPTVPLKDVVADINIDMIGRNWKDTIVAIGKEHSDLGATLNKVNAAHPELKMTAIDDIWPQEQFYYRSDHFNFARKGVPILFFFNGVHADYHQVTDSPDKIDGEKEARILKLIYFLGHTIGNDSARPQWKPESKKKIVETAAR